VTPAELRAYLHEQIPLAHAMQVEVLAVDDAFVELGAPLAPNRNHRSTAFGGSVSALAILAGWGWLRARLAAVEPLPQLVIQRQDIEFLRPVESGFDARCEAPPARDWHRFERAFAARGRARLELRVAVRCRGALAAEFRGAYVALGAVAGD